MFLSLFVTSEKICGETERQNANKNITQLQINTSVRSHRLFGIISLASQTSSKSPKKKQHTQQIKNKTQNNSSNTIRIRPRKEFVARSKAFEIGISKRRAYVRRSQAVGTQCWQIEAGRQYARATINRPPPRATCDKDAPT